MKYLATKLWTNKGTNEQRHSKKENTILLYFQRSFKWAAIVFHFIGTLRVICTATFSQEFSFISLFCVLLQRLHKKKKYLLKFPVIWVTVIGFVWQISKIINGAPAAKWRPITMGTGSHACMHRNRKPCNSFLMVNMASGMDRRCVCPMMTSCKIAALLRLIPSLAVLVYSVYLRYWTSMLLSIGTCQNKVSSDQQHMTILLPQV